AKQGEIGLRRVGVKDFCC
ncbi:hypothetical protein A2U01_0079608, partial [Trifolium medium]|nr:hypothetical protein [Trifolium medium]